MSVVLQVLARDLNIFYEISKVDCVLALFVEKYIDVEFLSIIHIPIYGRIIG